MADVTRYVLADFDGSEDESVEYDSYHEAVQAAIKERRQLLERAYAYEDTALIEDHSGHEVPAKIVIVLPDGTDDDQFFNDLSPLLTGIMVEQTSVGEIYDLDRCELETELGGAAAFSIRLFDERDDEMNVPADLRASVRRVLGWLEEETDLA